MPDNNINIQGGKYTTCDQTDHPHFYLAMTKAKVIPGKKVVTGPAYLVMEDVPIYFLGIPEGFFPISSGPKSGFLMPTYGEDGQRGFFFRDFGYYFTLSQHMDLALTAGIYTLGLWEGAAASPLHQTLQVHGQPQRPVLEHPHRREGRTRLPQTEHLPPAMDALAGSEGQPGLHLLRIGQLRHERLLQIRGHDDQ